LTCHTNVIIGVPLSPIGAARKFDFIIAVFTREAVAHDLRHCTRWRTDSPRMTRTDFREHGSLVSR
jgi:hypothetical protein